MIKKKYSKYNFWCKIHHWIAPSINKGKNGKLENPKKSSGFGNENCKGFKGGQQVVKISKIEVIY